MRNTMSDLNHVAKNLCKEGTNNNKHNHIKKSKFLSNQDNNVLKKIADQSVKTCFAPPKIEKKRQLPFNNSSPSKKVFVANPIYQELDKNKALALDFGIENLVTGASSDGKTFIIDGRRLKSINQWFNKEYFRLQSILEKQGLGQKQSRKQIALYKKRTNRIGDYLNKTGHFIIEFCLENKIGILVAGYNEIIHKSSHKEKVKDSNFIPIPLDQLRQKLAYLCAKNGITYIEQEESFTSKASFFDNDPIPVYGSKNIPVFSGTRVHRGMYQTASGEFLNADVNGALNILKKSNVVCLDELYSRGKVNSPERIRF